MLRNKGAFGQWKENGTVSPMNRSALGPIPSRIASAQALRRDASRYLLAAAMGLLVACWALAGPADLGWDHPAKAALLFGLASGVVWYTLGLPNAHPHARFGPANGITLLRLTLVLLMAALVGEPVPSAPLDASPLAAWALVVVATITALMDAVDGHLARKSGLSSAWGARFDMETDAFYILVLCALVVQAGQAGWWILASGLMRYAFVLSAWLWPWLAGPLAPSRRRQTVCVVQVTALIVCLGPIIPAVQAHWIAASSLALLCVSFLIDIRALARQQPPLKESTP